MTTMTTQSATHQIIEIEVIVRLAPTLRVDRPVLEAATMEIERILDQHALGITHGASASANFEAGTVEIDVVLSGETMSELSQKVALIVTQLDRHCESMQIDSGSTRAPALAVQASQMRRVQAVAS